MYTRNDLRLLMQDLILPVLNTFCIVSDSFLTPWTIALQAPLSMGFFRPEYWSGLPFPSPGDLHDPGIKLGSPTLQADSLPSESQGHPIAQGRGFHPQEEGSFGSRM